MKTSPLNATAHDVRAWLNTREDGTAIDPSKPTKTQHRVVVKIPKWPVEGVGTGDVSDLTPHDVTGVVCNVDDEKWYAEYPVGDEGGQTGVEFAPVRLPYAVGDELWVREGWSVSTDAQAYYRVPPDIPRSKLRVWYAADNDRPTWAQYNSKCSFRSPMHMPEWASRIRLRVTAVRVERLRSVCASDAYAEGFPYPTIEATAFYHQSSRAEQAIDWLRDQWNERSTNKDHQWESDPWVEVLETERIEMGNPKEER